jgi:hypothetical protein
MSVQSRVAGLGCGYVSWIVVIVASFRVRALSALFVLGLVVLAAACSNGGSKGAPTLVSDAPLETTPAASDDSGLIGKPQNRAAIGNVEAAFGRYESTRGSLVDEFKNQAWFKDGLTRDESLFIERSLTFVARYSGPRTAYVGEETVRRKLYKYDQVDVRRGKIELLLIYEPNQNADREMAFLKRVIPEYEAMVGVDYPTSVMTVVNGDFEINDFNDSEFIRIARCCTQSAFVLAHEIAHTYWSMGPSWFNEGMADVYATMMLERLRANPPEGWSNVSGSLDSFYRQRKALVERGRFPDMVLSRRFANDGLYEVASVFLLDIRQVMGAEAFADAVRDIYLQSDFGRYNLRDKRLEDLFLAHTKDAQRDAVMALFNKQVWGDNGERYQRLVELEAP